MKTIGTMSVGIKAPIIKAGDDIIKIVVDCVMNSLKENGLTLNDRDIVASPRRWWVNPRTTLPP